METLSQYSHPFIPVVLYLSRQTVVVIDSVIFEKEWQDSDLIIYRANIGQNERSHNVFFRGLKSL